MRRGGAANRVMVKSLARSSGLGVRFALRLTDLGGGPGRGRLLGVLHLPQAALFDERDEESLQHADLDAGQAVEKAALEHVELQKSQKGPQQEAEQSGPLAGV